MPGNALPTLPDDLATLISRLAARAALLTISKREHPAVVERLSDYMQDRGAVGLLLLEYAESDRIENVAYLLWKGHTEKLGSRFEDVITTILLGITSSIISGILVEMWKGEFGPLKRIFSDNEKELLRIQSRKEPRLRRDLDIILPFYNAKNDGQGVLDLSLAKGLYKFLAEGGSFSEFAERNPAAVKSISAQNLLKYTKDACLGVVKTELARPNFGSELLNVIEKKGHPLSPYLSFGEVISLYNVEELGNGQNWEKAVWSKINARRLYPDLWPSGVRTSEISPKILMLDDLIMFRTGHVHGPEWVAASSGVISTTSGMTSHISVLARNIGIGAIRCDLSETEKTESKFALFQEGRLRLYRDIPSLTTRQFEELIGAAHRRNAL